MAEKNREMCAMFAGLFGFEPKKTAGMTPEELKIMAEGWQQAQKQRMEEIVILAWLTAALMRQQKLPKLERLLSGLNRTKQRKVKDPKAELENLMAEFEAVKINGSREPISKNRG